MRLRRFAIRAASGSPIRRPNASTPAVARLKPRRQDPRDAQRTFPPLRAPNPRTSACGRALGTSGSLWRAARPSSGRRRGGTAIRRKPHRRGCLRCGDSRRAPRPSQRIAAYSAAQQRHRSIRHAARSRRRAVASGAGAAGPNTSPHGAASPACANAPPAAPASASAAAAAHAACAKPRLRAAGRPELVLLRRAVRAALGSRRHPPLACGLLRPGVVPPRSIGVASIGPRSFRAGMRGFAPPVILLHWRGAHAGGRGGRSRQIRPPCHAAPSQGHRQQRQPVKRHRALAAEKRARSAQQGQRRRIGGGRPGPVL